MIDFIVLIKRQIQNSLIKKRSKCTSIDPRLKILQSKMQKMAHYGNEKRPQEPFSREKDS